MLNASVTIRWALNDRLAIDRIYSDKVLDSFVTASAKVPALWYTETIHVLRCAEDNNKIVEATLTGFIYRLNALPITVDTASLSQIQFIVGSISREFNLSGYDAQYLELAKRCHLPLTTLDKALIKAAKKADVSIYLKN